MLSHFSISYAQQNDECPPNDIREPCVLGTSLCSEDHNTMGLGETTVTPWVPESAGTGKTPACIASGQGSSLTWLNPQKMEAYAKHMLALRPTPHQPVSR